LEDIISIKLWKRINEMKTIDEILDEVFALVFGKDW